MGLLVGTLRSVPTSGGVVAAAVFTVLIGLCVRYPTLLQDGSLAPDNSPNYSSMRVIVLTVVATFAVLTIKVGWGTTSLENLKIDESWAWVLAAALGGKVTQSWEDRALRHAPAFCRHDIAVREWRALHSALPRTGDECLIL